MVTILAEKKNITKEEKQETIDITKQNLGPSTEKHGRENLQPNTETSKEENLSKQPEKLQRIRRMNVPPCYLIHIAKDAHSFLYI